MPDPLPSGVWRYLTTEFPDGAFDCMVGISSIEHVGLGHYDRGNKLAITPLDRIRTVLQQLLLPILSRLNEEGDRYRSAYLRVVRQLMLFMTPAIHEVNFFFIHRLIHVPILYKWIHSIHHNSVNPSPWSSLSILSPRNDTAACVATAAGTATCKPTGKTAGAAAGETVGRAR